MMKKGMLVFTTEEVLQHKKTGGLGKSNYCFWETNVFPKQLGGLNSFPLYIAIKGKIKGYFIIHDYEDGEIREHAFCFHSESWKAINNGEELKPSQGWRYYPRNKK